MVGAAQIPPFTAPVVDEAGVVPAPVVQQVDTALLDYQQRSGNQVAVAVVKTTGGQSIEDYSLALARTWAVGQAGKDNGVVLVIAWDDHKLRIEVGKGLEGQLSDDNAATIVNAEIVPHLRDNDPGGAVVAGTNAIRRALGDTNVGEPAAGPAPVANPYDSPRYPSPSGPPLGSGSDTGFIVAIVVLALLPVAFALLFGRGRRRRGYWGSPIFWGGGGGYRGGTFHSSGSLSSFSSGGFSGGGGGFSGGGGGSFSGGGASGSW